VGQGQPLTKGFNNAISPRNCYNFSSLRIKIILKAFTEFTLCVCPTDKIISYFNNKAKKGLF